MSDLHSALGDISNIRKQMARTTQFRGYGPATFAGTGAAALLAAAVQALWLPDAANHVQAYLSLWIGTAALSSVVAGIQIYTRAQRLHSGLSDEMIHTAVEQFMPAVAAGMLTTVVLVHFAPAVLWMLPGIWQVMYSLGVFSSCRFLPRPMIVAGAWYLLTGLICLAFGGVRAFAPWTMGLAFGVGQLLISAILLVATPENEDEA